MFVTHFYENKTSILSQLLVKLPAVEEDIRIKGRKAKVLEVLQVDNNNFHVKVVFEKIPKKQPLKDLGKKKR
ncbi:hypothetical protein I6G82_09075 [Lysinibacillus macroides]|uniref:Preprotein translocase subunit SecA n=1 Tax=Lysinibacillus macroides TaxID=33935 RepID=A0A0M9DFR9_9BACI|nr:hypothetical protein [Lysinibacillus macroides]KOY80578.1 preprotein translocase subunit SecA [Lysinibacillus macroides]QPR69713.1 hypothetical protein I6G82_09075 [Lysinibacillus macroides]